jgi:diguanylate cyclase (GGDEF)-like protein
MPKNKKEQVEQVKVSEAEYSFAVNLMQYLVVPTFVLDAKGHVLMWNKACERLTGLMASEVVGTNEHWRGWYESPRPCLADLVVQNRMEELDALYVQHDDPTSLGFGLHAQNWCEMPQLGAQLYLAIDAGPIYDVEGNLLAVVETLRDMTTEKKAQIELERLAAHDGLTGLTNRRGFDERLDAELSRAIRDQQSMALIMIDVDHFKRFNDTYGHQLGDECLREVASGLLTAVLRPSDLVARYGGEEFAVILPSVDQAGAYAVAERIRESIAALAIVHSGNDALGVVTVSVGLACGVPSRGTNEKDLITLADKALYQAKRSGRNRVVALRWDDLVVSGV